MVKFKFCPLCKYPLIFSQLDNCKRLVCKKCGWIKYNNPIPVAICVAMNKKNEILITKRNFEPGKNKWALPGGFIEFSENPEQACLRELKEETNLDGKIIKLIGNYIQRTKKYGYLLVIGYAVMILKEEIIVNKELKEAKFINIKKIPYIPFSTHREIIDNVYKNKELFVF
jgi:ADP-ribose pyrophosphatase YjhB (NUDIX family)